MTITLEELHLKTSKLDSIWISEVVLQTSQFAEMRAWYGAVLGQPWNFENTPSEPFHALPLGEKQVKAVQVRACFMRLAPDFPYGGTLAIFEIPGITKTPTRDPGLNHMQFKNRGLDVLMKRIELLKAAGIHPQRSSNHGPVLSFYFKDPDKNIVEFCINNFSTAAEMMSFVQSEKFRKNPSGIELDRDEFLSRYYKGEPHAELLSI